jgi:hypothetical protein
MIKVKNGYVANKNNELKNQLKKEKEYKNDK